METFDRRIVDKMSENERKRYEEEIIKHLPDCSEKCELVDIELLMSQIPLKSNKAETEEEPHESD